MTTETITWIHVDEKLPPDFVTVLVFGPHRPSPIGMGWMSAMSWNYFDGDPVEGDGEVTHWAEMPKGPRA